MISNQAFTKRRETMIGYKTQLAVVHNVHLNTGFTAPANTIVWAVELSDGSWGGLIAQIAPEQYNRDIILPKDSWVKLPRGRSIRAEGLLLTTKTNLKLLGENL